MSDKRIPEIGITITDLNKERNKRVKRIIISGIL